MAPFTTPVPMIQGLKERIESVTVQGDRIYMGTSIGSLHVYSFDESTIHGAADDVSTSLVEVKKGLTRRSIDQLGFVKDVNSLVVLSDMTVSLLPVPSLSPPTPLVKAKAAFSFAIFSSVEHSVPAGAESPTGADFSSAHLKTKTIPVMVTQLIVGCRRKLVMYSWRDGEAQEVKEAPLPHSPRVIAFLNSETLSFAYSPTEHAIFSIPTLTATDISHTPNPTAGTVVAATGLGMSALTGLTGYMTLGLGAKPKPLTVALGNDEALVVKDNEGLIVGPDSKPSRPMSLLWPAPPDDITFIRPYIISVLPAGTVADPRSSPTITSTSTTTTLQIYSSLSLTPTQSLSFPFIASDTSALSVAQATSVPQSNATVRLLTSLQPSKAPVFFITTPVDRTAAAAEGSTLWGLTMRPWAEQVDEMVLAGQYRDALGLLNNVDDALLPDKPKRVTLIRALDAVTLFREGKYDTAIDTFAELNINPAKVVALYPESVAGRLSVPEEGWIQLFGGPAPVDDASSAKSRDSSQQAKGSPVVSDEDKEPDMSTAAKDLLDRVAIPASGSIRGRLRTGLGAFMPQSAKDDDTASINSKPRAAVNDDFRRSVETLVRYLSDHRPKVTAALENVGITPANQSHDTPRLSEVPVEELYALPNAPLSALTPEQLLRFAQIVNTALFKSYIVIRPGLLGPLCRVPNWCEVDEVEEELRARGKFRELIDLFHGKKMHAKALALLRQLSENEEDMQDKLGPSIAYLQKLGPEHIEHVFAASRWIFEQDRELAFDIFTSEDVELPRKDVADHLEKIDPLVCIRFIEYLIEEREEESHQFHDRLAELYLRMTLIAKKRQDTRLQDEMYSKLLHFIDTTNHFRIDWFYGVISSEDLYEARAILLGRMGRHDQALGLYVYQLHDYTKAEEYCKRVYKPGSETDGVFLTLLRIYLRPTANLSREHDLLQPALDLIARQSPRLDAAETLQLLPPLVTAQDVGRFLKDTLRAPVFDTQVVRNISKARNDHLSRQLMHLQSKRVKVTDSRICPQCHKRIGNSVIAVHLPRGEVTHYQCRDAFSKKISALRR
ncbi:Vacuolar morphoproteinsis protein 6 [Pleurotus pulmonarius]|nr:Vacuolar morphoproteinsis protein 6 [Pleurotus pulmonarius]